MRKVLLATTALVAVTGVTAANADISISGNYEWEYTTNDAGASFGDDSHLKITATTDAENGMKWTAVQTLAGGSDAVADAGGVQNAASIINMNAAYVQVEGEFGRVIFGDAENSAAQVMSSPLGRNQDIETQVALGTADTRAGFIGGAADITWYSPNISGFTVGVSKDLTDLDASAVDGQTDFALKYSMSGATVYYGAAEDSSSVGVSGSIAGFTVGVGARSQDGSDAKASDVGVRYTLANGITIAALSASGTAAGGVKTKANNFGASYTVAPGVKLNAETGKVGTANYTWVAVNMAF
jgi:hypothetical protein